ncbi:uncharacterized protein [Magallana gigas]|uniref:uncharacterized protein n=1 Tax=Magallana gigas TaxID=29159 RepID=UPI0033414529
MDVVIFCSLMYVAVSPTSTLKGGNICQRNVATDNGTLETKIECCSNSEEKNDMCVECSPGFRGYNCAEKCLKDYFGGKCNIRCSCNETQICHHVCGCLQRLDLNYLNVTNNGTSILLENVTYSPFAEECPTTTDVLSTSTGLMYKIRLDEGLVTKLHSVTTGTPNKDTNFKISFLIAAAGVTAVCSVFGIGLLYRLRLMRKKQECRVHHNMVYDLEDISRLRENPSAREEPAEPLYGECSYEDTCYSTLVLRVNNESGRVPNTSRQPVFTDDDNIYEFAQRYTHHSDEGQPLNVYVTDLIEATE